MHASHYENFFIKKKHKKKPNNLANLVEHNVIS